MAFNSFASGSPLVVHFQRNVLQLLGTSFTGFVYSISAVGARHQSVHSDGCST